MSRINITHFRSALHDWYQTHKRSLPWRGTNNPYYIWVSEIILQQTTVEQGLPYYTRFTEAFPNIYALAAAKEQDVLKLWQGLGYYSRARHMHKTAKEIVNKHGGLFPENYNDIIKLSGIGPYTAAAILSFAFGLPYPVIDGNVMRVVSRLFAIEEAVNTSTGIKVVSTKAHLLFDKNNPADFNQAIMEFGALHCRGHNPLCADCFAARYCGAFQKNIHHLLPAKVAKNKARDRYFFYIVPMIEAKGVMHTYIKKRTESDIWQNLYDFPLVETKQKYSARTFLKSKDYIDFISNLFPKTKPVKTTPFKKSYTHKLTHQTIHTRFVLLQMPIGKTDSTQQKIPFSGIQGFPLPKLIENFLKDLVIK